MLSTSILSYCNKLLDEKSCDLLAPLPPRKTISSSLSTSTSLTSSPPASNSFQVKYLGSSLVASKSSSFKNGIATFQRPLLDIYTLAQRKSLQRSYYSGQAVKLNQVADVCNYGIVIGESDPTGKTTLKANGVENESKDVVVTKVITPLSNIVLWAAVRFHSRVISQKKKTQLGATFLPLACSDAILNKDSFVVLTRKQRFLVSLTHSPLFLCVYRKVTDPKLFECHLLVCASSEDAVNLCSLLSCTLQQSAKVGSLQVPPPGQMGVYTFKGYQRSFPGTSSSSPDVHQAFENSDSDVLQSNKRSTIHTPSLSHYSRTSSDCKHRIRKRNEKNLQENARHLYKHNLNSNNYPPRIRSANTRSMCDLPSFSELSLSDSNVKSGHINRRRRDYTTNSSINRKKNCSYCCCSCDESTKSGTQLQELIGHERKRSPRRTAEKGFTVPDGTGWNGKGRTESKSLISKYESESSPSRRSKSYSSLLEKYERCDKCGAKYQRSHESRRGGKGTSGNPDSCRFFGDSNYSSSSTSEDILVRSAVQMLPNSSRLNHLKEKPTERRNGHSGYDSSLPPFDSSTRDANGNNKERDSVEVNNYNGYVVTVDHKHKEHLVKGSNHKSKSNNNRSKPKKTMVITKSVLLSTETESNSDSVLARNESQSNGHEMVCSCSHQEEEARSRRRRGSRRSSSLEGDAESPIFGHRSGLERIQESRELEIGVGRRSEPTHQSPKSGGVKMYLPQGVKSFHNYEPVQKWATLSLVSDLDEEVVTVEPPRSGFNYPTQSGAETVVSGETKQIICKLRSPTATLTRTTVGGQERRISLRGAKSKSNFLRKMRKILVGSKDRTFLNRFRRKKRRKKGNLFDSGIEVTSCENSLNNLRIEDLLANCEPHMKCDQTVWNPTFEETIPEYETRSAIEAKTHSGKQKSGSKVNSSDSGMDENDGCLNNVNHRNCSRTMSPSKIMEGKSSSLLTTTTGGGGGGPQPATITSTRSKTGGHQTDNKTVLVDYRNWSNVNLQKELGYLP